MAKRERTVTIERSVTEIIPTDINSALLLIKSLKRSEISEAQKSALLSVLKISFPVPESKNKGFANIYGGSYDATLEGIKFTLTSNDIPVFNKKGEIKSKKTESLLFTVSAVSKGSTLKNGSIWEKESFIGISASLRETFIATEINW